MSWICGWNSARAHRTSISSLERPHSMVESGSAGTVSLPPVYLWSACWAGRTSRGMRSQRLRASARTVNKRVNGENGGTSRARDNVLCAALRCTSGDSADEK